MNIRTILREKAIVIDLSTPIRIVGHVLEGENADRTPA